MKKFILILIASIGNSFYLSAQSAGDYRSIANGDWNDATKWEKYNGNSWVSSTFYPGQQPNAGAVTIMKETEIKVTASIPNPIAKLSISTDNPTILTKGILAFSAATPVTLSVSGNVVIGGELRIDNQIGTKTHKLVISGNLNVFDFIDYECPCWISIFQTINEDDKLDVIFNSAGAPNWINNPSSQYISFQDITINGAGIMVNTNISIAGTATFINGVVTPGMKSITNGMDILSEFDICFLEGATASGASHLSYIDGPASKWGAEPFTFPLGCDGFYAPFTISGIAQPEIFYAYYHRNSYETQQAITDPGLFSISNCEAWSLIRDIYNPVNASIDVTVGWNSATRCESSSYISNASDVVLAYFDWNTSTWNSHGGTGTGTTANGSITSNYIGTFTLGNVGTDCRTPANLTLSNITSNSAIASWSAVPGAVSYDVEYNNTSTTSLSTSANLTGLNPGTSYSVRVRANCGSSSSSYRVIQFTTLNDCGLPSVLTATNITSNSATLSWAPAPNAVSYTIQYGYITSYDYSELVGINTLSYQLSGLNPSTLYKWRVIARCPSGVWGYVESSFTTLPPYCNDVYETNNTSSHAKAIPIGSAISAGISSAADVDWFKIITPNNSNSNLLVDLENLPADYDLYVYNKSLKLVGSSMNNGTLNETVTYNSSARKATYYIKVIGKNGAYNPSYCYNLLARVSNGPNSASSKSYPANEVTEISEKQLLYPNPASEFVYLNFNSATEGVVNMQIVNSIGQLVKQLPVNTIKGQNQFKIQVNDIRPGMYILRINKGDLNITRKFVIAR